MQGSIRPGLNVNGDLLTMTKKVEKHGITQGTAAGPSACFHEKIGPRPDQKFLINPQIERILYELITKPGQLKGAGAFLSSQWR
jgi:hypothetical protein